MFIVEFGSKFFKSYSEINASMQNFPQYKLSLPIFLRSRLIRLLVEDKLFAGKFQRPRPKIRHEPRKWNSFNNTISRQFLSWLNNKQLN